MKRFLHSPILSLLAIVFGTLALPPVAARAAGSPPTHLAPPGNPAVTEYLEDVPSAGGSTPVGGGGRPAHPLSAAQIRRLNQLGVDGKLLVNVDNQSGPQVTATPGAVGAGAADAGANPRGGSSATGSEGPGSRPAGSANRAPQARTDPRMISGSGSGSVSAVVAAATGQGAGAGGLLLPALIAAGVLVVWVSVLRRRRGAR